MKHLFPYRWNIADGYPAKGIVPNGSKVFGTFICGGGSTMGYKLAGYTHIGGVEIDPEVSEAYKANHAPKYLFTEDIRAFNKRVDLPDELFDLDILDGSPPCSSFSMAGNREKDWGKAKVFREGQAHQTLDDLFFDFIALAKRLQPKVVIAENVKGMIHGNAKSYVRRIAKEFVEAGYSVQLFMLNGASMGIPQRRERVFFVCGRKDMNFPRLTMKFNEPGIPFREIFDPTSEHPQLSASNTRRWHETPLGANPTTAKGNTFGYLHRLCDSAVPPTVLSGQTFLALQDEPRDASEKEYSFMGSFPQDYNYKSVKPKYLIGMSVPPVMMAQVSHQVNVQWLSRIKDQ